jgi:hypothetical protein
MSAIRRTILILAAAALPGVCAGPATAAGPTNAGQIEQLETAVIRAEDVRTLKNLQRAYGYYADRGLWDDLANLFADDAIANYPSGGFDGKASIRAMFVENLGQGKQGLAEGRIYNHTILQPVIDLAADGATATGRWRVLGMLGSFGRSATWADSLYRFDYVKQGGKWQIKVLTAYAGSGGGYENGWTRPAPRPPGAADRSPIRFNLAHPADRDWRDPCEADTSICVVPFPYPNRGSLQPPIDVKAMVGSFPATSVDSIPADLVRRARQLADEQAVQNLQNAWGYYIDRGMWKEAAALFTPDGTRETGQAGVYVGRDHIRRALELDGPRGLREGQLNDHLQIEPIVTVAADGRTAQARIFELAFVGGGGEPARIVQNVAENTYVKQGDAWLIKAMHVYTILATDYAQGWAKSALPAPTMSKTFPPDRPPTVAYEAYPKVFTPPLHFTEPTGVPHFPTSSLLKAPTERELAAALKQAQQVMDWHEIENLQNAYGYYSEKSLWSDIAQLFAADGVFEVEGMRIVGSDNILGFLKALGPEGPVKDALNSQLQLQPVIHVAADGRSAKIRSRLLQLARDSEGRPLWGGGIYENELVKDNGVWKFKRLHLYQSYQVLYQGGWAPTGSHTGQMLPTTFTPPFHYKAGAVGR